LGRRSSSRRLQQSSTALACSTLLFRRDCQTCWISFSGDRRWTVATEPRIGNGLLSGKAIFGTFSNRRLRSMPIINLDCEYAAFRDPSEFDEFRCLSCRSAPWSREKSQFQRTGSFLVSLSEICGSPSGQLRSLAHKRPEERQARIPRERLIAKAIITPEAYGRISLDDLLSDRRHDRPCVRTRAE
jgi:hypothetical protein